MIFKTGVRILEATVAVSANRRSLLPSLPPPLEVKSLRTDFREVEEVPFSARADGSIEVVENSSAKPRYLRADTKSFFSGPLIRLSRGASDPRFSLWGNQGFLYRFVLFLLEKRHGIFSLHAGALYQPAANRLYVIAGGAGSGKTVFLLSGLENGLELFSTEMVHFRDEGDRFRWLMGSLVDNVRLETLRLHFPRFLPLALRDRDEPAGLEKRAIDLSPYRSRHKALLGPEVILLFPRIESGLRTFTLNPLPDPRGITRSLFANISEKLAETIVLYDRIPVPGFDRRDLAEARLQAARSLASQRDVIFCGRIFSGPRQCWGHLLHDDFEKRR